MNRLRWLFRRHADRELSREIDAHIAERVDDLVDGGIDETAARTQARREFGNARLQVERSREVWVWRWLTSVAQDLRYAVRSLARQPGFALSAIGILSIGIGLVTMLFGVINGLVLRPWAVPGHSKLAIVLSFPAAGQAPSGLLPSPEYRYLREHSTSFSHLAAWMPSHVRGVGGARIVHGDDTRGLDLNFVSANYFDALGIGMKVGHAFRPEDEDYLAPRAVVVVSEWLWRDFFAASESIVGDTIHVDDRPFTVIGVARDFRGVDGSPVDLWLPLPSVALGRPGNPGNVWLQQLADPTARQTFVVGRLRAGVSRSAAQAEVTGIGRQFRTSIGMESHGFALHSTRPISRIYGHAALLSADDKSMFAIIGLAFGALLLVMLLACANVGNLILARGLSRQREIAIRLTLGASRGRVARQLLTESIVISLIAGAMALWLASLAPRLGRFAGFGAQQLSPDAPVFGFALFMATIACLVSGVMPALRSTRGNLISHANDRHPRFGGPGHLRTSLLATQIALSMVLLVGAGLLTRTIYRVVTSGPGFDIRGLQAFNVQPPRGLTAEGRSNFTRTLRNALKAANVPAAWSEFSAIAQVYSMASIRKEGEPRDRAHTLPVRGVSSNYFHVLQMPLVAGRPMADDDEPQEVVVSELAAKLLWPGESPLGKRLVSSKPPAAAISDSGDDVDRFHEVVGVVKDVPFVWLTRIEPAVYVPAQSHNVFFIRDPSPSVADQVAAIASGIEPRARLTAHPVADDVRRGVGALAIGSGFAWATGLLALVLSAIGAFGVFAYMVEERRREIGVRMALGARAPQVIRTILTATRRPLIAGLGAGLVLSMLGAKFLRSFLYGLSPFDPVTYLGISAILVVAALVATWIPARRAARIDPAITLRAE